MPHAEISTPPVGNGEIDWQESVATDKFRERAKAEVRARLNPAIPVRFTEDWLDEKGIRK